MDESFTPTYRVAIRTTQGHYTPMEWQVRGRYGMRGYGAPTAANLAAFVHQLEASHEPGGVNAHVGPTMILQATIVRQANNLVMAQYAR